MLMAKNSFFTYITDRLRKEHMFSLQLATLPISYQEQPYNLAAKLKDRANLPVGIVVDKKKNLITLFIQQ